MVISIMFVVLGLVSMAGLPIAQFPEIVPPEVQILTTYTGADAETVEQSVATPIEQQMSGVDNMNYMYSVNASNGTMRIFVNFDVKTDPNTDLILAQIRQNLAQPQLPIDVRNYGVTMQKARSSPLMIIALSSPKGTYDSTFLANYANINLIDPMLRVPGMAMVNVFGAGQYAMRIWVKPDTLGKLGITVPDIVSAVQKQNTVNPAGQIGAEPAPPGQEFTYTVRAQGRLVSPEEFGGIVVRANPDGSIVRLSDVARIELGAQTYNVMGRVDGQPAGVLALYQLPGTNALQTVGAQRRSWKRLRSGFLPISTMPCTSTRQGPSAKASTRCSSRCSRPWASSSWSSISSSRDGGRPLSRSSPCPSPSSAPSPSFRCSGSPSTPYPFSAWSSPSAWSSMTPSSWSRRWSAISRRA